MPQITRRRIHLCVVLIAVIICGLGSRKFDTPLPDFIHANAGDTLWTVAVYLSLAILAPSASAWKLGIASLGISFAVEFSQLIDPPWLNHLRDTLPGKLLLGRAFLTSDLIRYTLGAATVVVADQWLRPLLSSKRGHCPRAN